MPSNYYNPYYPTQSNAYPTQMNVGATQPTQMPQQMQDGGFVSIPNEEMVYSYPVGMGKCVTFKVEGKPIILEKSMGFSQFEAPRVKRYRLVEEETEKSTETRELTDIDKMKSDIKEIWGKIDEIENSKRYTPKRENKNGES